VTCRDENNSIASKKQRLRLDWILALTVTAAAVFLHLAFLKDAGGLWRDEAGVVRLATLPAFGETWKYLGHESCPLFFPAAIRFWSVTGLGGTDFGLRIYGLIVGLLLLGASWFNAWTLTRSVPLISLGLLAANIAVVLGRFIARLRNRKFLDAADRGADVALCCRAKSQSLAARVAGGAGRRAMRFSKCFSAARGLRRGRRGLLAAQRHEEYRRSSCDWPARRAFADSVSEDHP
jgi:predicted membrane-bound mannosyltransferase